MRPALAAAALLTLACGAGGARVEEAPAPARTETVAAPRPIVGDSAAYRRLRDRLRGGDLSVPFDSLRLAYAASDAYDPYGVDSDRRKAMFEALDRGDHAAARAAADSTLAENYVDGYAHMAASVAARESGDSAAARFHRAVFRGLIESIGARGGRTPDSAMLVISVDEEYVFLQALGLRRGMQALTDCAGRACDALEVVDRRTGEKYHLFFDVSIPTARLARQFEEP